MKIASLLLAVFNSAIAGLIILFSLSSAEIQQSSPVWTLVKVTAALLVVAIGALTWFTGKSQIDSNAQFISGLLLVVLGTAAIVWTLHLAILTGDMEHYMIVYGGSLLFQAVLTLWAQRQRTERLSLS